MGARVSGGFRRGGRLLRGPEGRGLANELRKRWAKRREGGGTYFNGILRAETELQAVGFALVDGVGVHDLDVHEPGLEVVGLDERYAWREFLVHLCPRRQQPDHFVLA